MSARRRTRGKINENALVIYKNSLAYLNQPCTLANSNHRGLKSLLDTLLMIVTCILYFASYTLLSLSLSCAMEKSKEILFCEACLHCLKALFANDSHVHIKLCWVYFALSFHPNTLCANGGHVDIVTVILVVAKVHNAKRKARKREEREHT